MQYYAIKCSAPTPISVEKASIEPWNAHWALRGTNRTLIAIVPAASCAAVPLDPA